MKALESAGLIGPVRAAGMSALASDLSQIGGLFAGIAAIVAVIVDKAPTFGMRTFC